MIWYYLPAVPFVMYGIARVKLIESTELRLRQLDEHFAYFKQLLLSDKSCWHHATCGSEGPKNTPAAPDPIDHARFENDEIFDIDALHSKLKKIERGREKLKEIHNFVESDALKAKSKTRKSATKPQRKA